MSIENYSMKFNSISISNKVFRDRIMIKFSFSLIFAGLMCISANAFMYLPFTPIPITMQVLTVLISSLFLGSYWAAISQLEYILLGLSGLPVFSGFKSGIAALIGPTGGYIIGFLMASFIVGFLYESFISNNNLSNNNFFSSNIKNLILKRGLLSEENRPFYLFILLSAGVVIIYICGYIHLLGFLFNFNKGLSFKDLLVKTWQLGVNPFIIIDLIKILIIINIDKINKISNSYKSL